MSIIYKYLDKKTVKKSHNMSICDFLLVYFLLKSKHMNVSRLPNPQSWMELLEEINYVIQNPGCCKTLTIDTCLLYTSYILQQ